MFMFFALTALTALASASASALPSPSTQSIVSTNALSSSQHWHPRLHRKYIPSDAYDIHDTIAPDGDGDSDNNAKAADGGPVTSGDADADWKSDAALLESTSDSGDARGDDGRNNPFPLGPVIVALIIFTVVLFVIARNIYSSLSHGMLRHWFGGRSDSTITRAGLQQGQGSRGQRTDPRFSGATSPYGRRLAQNLQQPRPARTRGHGIPLEPAPAYNPDASTLYLPSYDEVRLPPYAPSSSQHGIAQGLRTVLGVVTAPAGGVADVRERERDVEAGMSGHNHGGGM